MACVNLVTTIADKFSPNFQLIKPNKPCIELKLDRANIPIKPMLLIWALGIMGLDSIELTYLFFFDYYQNKWKLNSPKTSFS